MVPPSHAPLTKGHELANTITINHLTARLKANPAADLSQLLQHQTAVYPALRDSLGRSMASRPVLIENSVSEQIATPNGSFHSFILLRDECQITIPLSRELLDFVGLPVSNDSATVLSPDSITTFNSAIQHSQILWELCGARVLSIGPRIVVKIAPSLDLDEMRNLQYVHQHVPAVPAPQCLGAFRSGRLSYFWMSRAEGVTLESVWPDLSCTLKRSVQQQLNAILIDLRATRRSKGTVSSDDGGDKPRIGSFGSGVCKDVRIKERVCPRAVYDEADFNDFLCHDPVGTVQTVTRMARASMRDDHQIVMTHGDLHPRNIMVLLDDETKESSLAAAAAETDAAARDNDSRRIRITALIDWENSGWYPEHWEFVKALTAGAARGPLVDWCEYLPTNAIGEWPAEYCTNMALGRRFGG